MKLNGSNLFPYGRCYKKRADCFVRTITDLHRCKICREHVVCDEDSLERHIADEHAASLEDYVNYVNLAVRAANSFEFPETEEEETTKVNCSLLNVRL